MMDSREQKREEICHKEFLIRLKAIKKLIISSGLLCHFQYRVTILLRLNKKEKLNNSADISPLTDTADEVLWGANPQRSAQRRMADI